MRTAVISSFSNMKGLGVFLLPLGWDASPSQGFSLHFASTHLYTGVERGTENIVLPKNTTQCPEPAVKPEILL